MFGVVCLCAFVAQICGCFQIHVCMYHLCVYLESLCIGVQLGLCVSWMCKYALGASASMDLCELVPNPVCVHVVSVGMITHVLMSECMC